MFKLFKYDFRAIIKRLAPLYIVGVVIGILNLGVSLAVNYFFIKNSSVRELTPLYAVMEIIKMLISFVFSFLAMYISILTIYILITNFNSSVYGNEGYLINSLPIKSKELIFAKYLNFIFWTFVSSLFGLIFQIISQILNFIRIYGIMGTEDETKEVFSELFNTLNLQKNEILNSPFFYKTIIFIIIIGICIILFSLLSSWIYMTSVTVANVIKGSKIVIGVLTYLIIYFGIGIVSLIMFVMSIFELNNKLGFSENPDEFFNKLLEILIKYGIIYIIFLVLLNIGVSFFINYIHAKKLDLE